jgi:uncharacterized protein YqiB (DUF1249 family)
VVAVAIKKRRYQLDFAAGQAECEANYLRLLRLLREFDADHHAFGLGVEGQMVIAITERCPYTTTLDISQSALPLTALAPRLTVRVYHDARLAEVIAFANRRRIQPRYEYPNPAMYQPDEKAQWNRFLGEWLSHCLQHGRYLDRSLSQFCEL